MRLGLIQRDWRPHAKGGLGDGRACTGSSVWPRGRPRARAGLSGRGPWTPLLAGIARGPGPPDGMQPTRFAKGHCPYSCQTERENAANGAQAHELAGALAFVPTALTRRATERSSIVFLSRTMPGFREDSLFT